MLQKSRNLSCKMINNHATSHEKRYNFIKSYKFSKILGTQPLLTIVKNHTIVYEAVIILSYCHVILSSCHHSIKNIILYNSNQVIKYSSTQVNKYSRIQVFKYRIHKLVTDRQTHTHITYNVKSRDPIGSKKNGRLIIS